ncbi:MAG: DUF5522 domain-containing protein [Acidobacteriaceae bacterium]
MTKPGEQDPVSPESPAMLHVSDQRERTPQPAPQAQLPVRQASPKEGEDFYWEGPYMVFTAAWHFKRGYCCGSACRHCPYGHENVPQKSGSSQ